MTTIKYAITGGIASGKTTTLSLFKLLGFPTFNADKAVKTLMNQESIQQQILTKYPKIKSASKELDRQKLSNLAFKDPKVLQFLENIFHPKLDKIRKKQIQEANRNYRKGICFEIPLLFEKKLEKEFDIIILTFCSKKTQYERALLRKRIDRTKLSRILNSQSSDTYRKKRADFKINTGIGKNHTMSEIKIILNKTIYKKCVK